MIRREQFPHGFLWGVATAAYQIEGSPQAEGKGESIWDRFCRIPGKIQDGTTGDVACDHYRRWRDDLGLLKELGVNAYRFSISWPRVFPEGKGRLNQAGLDFYSRLVDALLEASITPAVTIWHGDQPQALEDLGGWVNREMIRWFADYAEAVFLELGDRVKLWITLNEPNCFLYYGYGTGIVAPGVTDWRASYQAVHHSLVAHGEAVRRFRSCGRPGQIGITMSVDLWSPESDAPQDAAAAQRAEIKNNWWLLDPLYLGRYPDAFLRDLEDLAPAFHAQDFEITSTPCDFLGWNYYGRNRVRAGDVGVGAAAKTESTALSLNPDPPGLQEVLSQLNARYGPQTIYITENGLYRQGDPPLENGVYQDPERVSFLEHHLSVLARAIEAGNDIRGYFHWTLMDNFEWSGGHLPRLGLYYTDYNTQARIPKSSALWYRDFLAGL